MLRSTVSTRNAHVVTSMVNIKFKSNMSIVKSENPLVTLENLVYYIRHLINKCSQLIQVLFTE